MTTAIAALTEAVERRRAADYPGALESARRAVGLLASSGSDPARRRRAHRPGPAEEDMGHYDLAQAAAARAVRRRATIPSCGREP